MLAHFLAVLLGFSSFTFYIAAFFYPEVHRRSDLLWSGLGMLYAVMLWFGAGQMTSTVLLGQITAVVLLLGLGWQTLTVRREKTPVYQQTPVVMTPEVVGSWAKNKINQLRIAPDDTVRPLPPQNRSLRATAAKRFRQDIDPRRRPVYDYQFVEDGELLEGNRLLGDDSPLEGSATQPFPDVIAADFQSLDDDWGDASAEPTLVPPSAAAEILTEIPEIPLETSFKETSSNAVDAMLTAPIDIPPSAEEVVLLSEPSSSEPSSSEPSSADAAAEIKVPVNAAMVSAAPDDWGADADDWLNETQTQSRTLRQDNRQRLQSEPASEKNDSLSIKPRPSLLAAPIILLGWVKDVASAMTKPKPSKPVIDIPRRDLQPLERTDISTNEPNEPNESNESVDISTSEPFADVPDADSSTTSDGSTTFDNTDNFDDDNDWEDSNWDD